MLDLIKNKRVIFVGAATNLVGRGMGKEIDSFDVVCRPNGFHRREWRRQYKDDYGFKTDVMYFNVQHAREMRPLPARKCAADGIKWFVFKALSKADNALYSQYVKCRDISNIISVVHKHVFGALMGLFIIEDLLQFEPAELHLTGIDFFITKKPIFEVGNYQEYLDGYLPEKIEEQGNIINIGKTDDGHNQKTNTEYIYKLWKDGKIIMPDFITKVMCEICQ